MNDTTKQLLADYRQPSASAPMPTALALYLDDALYDRVSSVASRMSKAAGVTPKHLIGAPEACFAVVSRAITWRLDPFAVAMATYQTPGGQIGFEGKLVHAIIENSGCLDPAAGGIRYEHYGDWSHVQGHFGIKETQGDGKMKKYAVPTWTDEDARKGKPDDDNYPLAQSCGVRVIPQLRGEPKPRILDFDLIQAQPRNSTLWATDPMTQICYTAIRRFGSVVAPTLLMGVPFDPVDRFTQPGEIDVTEARPAVRMPQPIKAQADQATVDAMRAGTPISVEIIGNGSAGATAHPVSAEIVDHETGEIATEPAENGPLASDLAGDVPTPPEAAAAAPAAPNAAMSKPASDAQKRAIENTAKRLGLSASQVDEIIADATGFNLASLPSGGSECSFRRDHEPKMIWGTTTTVDWRSRIMTPRRWFAWHPVQLEDGRTAWLETVMCVGEFLPLRAYWHGLRYGGGVRWKYWKC